MARGRRSTPIYVADIGGGAMPADQFGMVVPTPAVSSLAATGVAVGAVAFARPRRVWHDRAMTDTG